MKSPLERNCFVLAGLSMLTVVSSIVLAFTCGEGISDDLVVVKRDVLRMYLSAHRAESWAVITSPNGISLGGAAGPVTKYQRLPSEAFECIWYVEANDGQQLSWNLWISYKALTGGGVVATLAFAVAGFYLRWRSYERQGFLALDGAKTIKVAPNIPATKKQMIELEGQVLAEQHPH